MSVHNFRIVSMAWGALLLSVGLVTSLPGCNETECPSVECPPGASRGCTCTNGASGAQSCVLDGSQYGECFCDGTGGDGDTDVDGDTDTDTDADADSDTDIDADADSDPDCEPELHPADCDYPGTYLVDGEVAFCRGCEWGSFNDETFILTATENGADLTFDGFTHGPLMVDESTGGVCVVHGYDSWTRDEYVQDGGRSYSGVGTYHVNIEGGSLQGLLSWVITEYVDGVPTFTDCEVTFHLTGTRM